VFLALWERLVGRHRLRFHAVGGNRKMTPLVSEEIEWLREVIKDAKRYRWLRQQHWNKSDTFVLYAAGKIEFV
jgi:hypothetical protein